MSRPFAVALWLMVLTTVVATANPCTAGNDDDDKVAFESITVSFRAPLSRKPPERVRIDGDGSCQYVIDELSARGQLPARPGAILESQIDGKRLAALERLLENTDWLKAAGGEGRALHTDAGEVKIALVRDGKTHTITCLGDRPEPYRSLLRFFYGITEQEHRLHQLTGGDDRERDDACRTIRFEIEALMGQSGRALPHYDIDQRRYLVPLASMVRKPKGIPDEQMIAAIKLVTYVGAESEFDAIASLKGDRLRDTVAESLAEFGGERAVAVLARLARSNMEALWGLIRLGEIAVPTLVKLIEPGTTPGDVTSEQAVRAYIEHWNELPGPVDERIVTAARQALGRAFGGRTEYFKAFLKLAESDPVPPPGLSCRIDGSTVLAVEPLQFVHGWYVVADNQIVEQHPARAPEAGIRHFGLKFDGRAAGQKVHLQTIHRPMRFAAGYSEGADVKDEGDIDVPEGAQLEVVYTVWRKHEQSNHLSPIRVTNEYRTLWEGHLVKDGRTLRRIMYVARVAKPDEPLQDLWPPAAPAAPRGGPAPPPLVITYRGVTLSDKQRLTDPAVLYDLAIALKNDTILDQGGTPDGESQAEVTVKPHRDDAGREFVVYRDPKLKMEYVQVIIREPGEPLKSLFYGPFEEGRLKKRDRSKEGKKRE